jgi:hypothetical protein
MGACLAVFGLLAAGAAATGSRSKQCGVVSYSFMYHGHRHSGKDAVSVVRGSASCARARQIDVRADEGLRNPGWRCVFSRHQTVTTCTSRSRKVTIRGVAQKSTTSAPSPTTTTGTTTAWTTTTTSTSTETTSTPAPSACYPLSNSGGCYEPGEFCRASDHGMSGVAGDGEAIICEYNNGWRWEPN